MSLLHALRFASDATLLGLAGAACMVLAVAAWWGDRRRSRRKHIDAVGWMPWTSLFLLAFGGGVVFLALALRA